MKDESAVDYDQEWEANEDAWDEACYGAEEDDVVAEAMA
jgi:hypothetical protein